MNYDHIVYISFIKLNNRNEKSTTLYRSHLVLFVILVVTAFTMLLSGTFYFLKLSLLHLCHLMDDAEKNLLLTAYTWHTFLNMQLAYLMQYIPMIRGIYFSFSIFYYILVHSKLKIFLFIFVHYSQIMAQLSDKMKKTNAKRNPS